MDGTTAFAAPWEDWDAEQDASRAHRDARRLRLQLRWVVGLVALATAVVGLAIAIGPVAGAAGGCGGG
jgi:fatty acid desaturase